MPEGPECKFYVDVLNELLQGKTVTDIKIIDGRYVRRGAPSGFKEFKLPHKIIQVGVKGKFIFFQFDTCYVWNTLGMTGCWTDEQDKDTRLVFSYGRKKLYFGDKRNFGTFKFGMTADETATKLNSLGFDLLNTDEPSESSVDLFSLRRNKDKTLPEILMDQKNYAGVGNYIKSEALYRAKLSPHRTGGSLSAREIKRLHETISSVMKASYATKRVKLANTTDMPACGAEFKKIVYKQEYDPQGYEVVAEDTKDKRTTYWVPELQK